MQSAVPEAMFSSDPNDSIITAIPSAHKFTSVAIGPGIGTADATIMAA